MSRTHGIIIVCPCSLSPFVLCVAAPSAPPHRLTLRLPQDDEMALAFAEDVDEDALEEHDGGGSEGGQVRTLCDG